MKKSVAVILAGCGAKDGTEIYEATLTLLRLDQLDIGYRCFAPDMEQQVIDHRTGDVMANERRNVLVESARLARGEIEPLEALDPDAFTGLIIPGGFGVAQHLCNFLEAGANMEVLPQVRDKVVAFHEAAKPIGLMCIAPVLAPRLLGDSVPVTIGQDPGVAGTISAMGGLHRSCKVGDIVIDHEHRVITTPAYMLAERISEAASGIFKLVDKLDEMMSR